MAIRDVFSPADLDALREATVAAEARTSGEIITTVVESCDSYEGALWKSAALGSIVAALAAGLWTLFVERWGVVWLWLTLPALTGAAAGFVLPIWFPALHRALVGKRLLESRVARRATAAFLEQEVFATRERSGVLIFVGLFEHRVELLRDRAAQQSVPADSWEDLTERLVRGIKKKAAPRALVQAIEDCGRLLELHGLVRRDDGVDELPNAPRLFDD